MAMRLICLNSNGRGRPYMLRLNDLKHLWVYYQVKLIQASMMMQSKSLSRCYWAGHLIEFAEKEPPAINEAERNRPGTPVNYYDNNQFEGLVFLD